MATAARNEIERDESRRRVIIIVAVVSAVAIGVLFYLLLRATGSGPSATAMLENGIRGGAPEFAGGAEKIVLDEPEADEAKRALGDTVMSLHTTVRNFTGRTLNGLEIKGAVVDRQGKAIKERTVVVIPNRQPELEPNKILFVQIMLEGFKDTDDRANIKMEVTAFRYKQ